MDETAGSSSSSEGSRGEAARRLLTFAERGFHDCTIDVLFASGTSKLTYRRAKIDEGLVPTFRDLVVRACHQVKQAADRVHGAEFIEYLGHSDPDENDVVHVDLAHNERLADQFPDMNLSALAHEEFTLTDASLKSLRLIGYLITCPDGYRLFAVSRITPGRCLRRGLSVLLVRNHLVKLETDPLVLPESIDALLFDGHLFVTNVDNFEKAFRLHEQLITGARSALASVCEKIGLPDHFVDWCTGRARPAAKIIRVSQSGIAERLTLDRVEAVAAGFRLAGISAYVGDDGRLYIDFDPNEAHAALKLLDQDYVLSPLTDDQFEATRKKSIDQK